MQRENPAQGFSLFEKRTRFQKRPRELECAFFWPKMPRALFCTFAFFRAENGLFRIEFSGLSRFCFSFFKGKCDFLIENAKKVNA